MTRPVRGREYAALGLITAGAAALRLIALNRVPPDPFYDAAVRSMTLSFHNFFFGAYEPGGSVSIDKPPIDLWLQVVSVKLLGFSSTTLKLPEAFGGTIAVPLLFAAVRRMWSSTAGLAAALALAVLPIDVITSRSDTMDAVMMALLVLALLFIVRACQSGRMAWLLAAAAVLGVAFDVKLLESIVALPGLALLAALGLPWSRRRRIVGLLAAAAVYVVVALSWLTATLLVPAHERPYAIGSTNGSAWNAAFVFNGTERLKGKSTEPQFTQYQPGHHYADATQQERDHIPIVPPSPTRLLARVGPLSGQRLGLELLIALLLGVPAFVSRLRTRRSDPGADPDSAADRLKWAVAGGLSLWMLTGIALFSDMVRLHPRYVESFTPAVAAMLGIGVAWAAEERGRARLVALLVALAATVYYVERLLYSASLVWWVVFAAALGAGACAVLASAAEPPLAAPTAGAVTRTERDERSRSLLSAATVALSLIAVLALSLHADANAIENHVTDAGDVGALPPGEQALLSNYLRAHQDGARYEVVAESATQIGALIAQDGRPVIVLTTYNARPFTSLAKLQALIAAGEVRYALVDAACGRHSSALNPGCSAPARWVRAHGTDVSRQAGFQHSRVLWRLPGAAA